MTVLAGLSYLKKSSRKTSNNSKGSNGNNISLLKIDKSKLLNYNLKNVSSPVDLNAYVEISEITFPPNITLFPGSTYC
jgi:hypothetical protein